MSLGLRSGSSSQKIRVEVPARQCAEFLCGSRHEWEQHRPRRPPAPHTHAPALPPPLRAGGEKQRADARAHASGGHARAASAAAGRAASAPRPAGHACRARGPVGASASEPPPSASLKPLARTGSHVSHCVIFHSHCQESKEGGRAVSHHPPPRPPRAQLSDISSRGARVHAHARTRTHQHH